MAESSYRVLITTSGTGTRLLPLTKFTNKALVSLGRRPALSYIIDQYPSDVPIVITLGHFGDLIREFLSLAYPDRSFHFVYIDRYEGPGTSLAYSLLQAQNELQCPFIFHACDTIVRQDSIPAPAHNWVAYLPSHEASQYMSLSVAGDKLLQLIPKGNAAADKIHIGLAGIYDWQAFWRELSAAYSATPDDPALNDATGINRLLSLSVPFTVWPVKEWLDVGNFDSLRKARLALDDPWPDVLEKPEEAIYLLNDTVYKFFADAKIVRQRVDRSRHLAGLIPTLTGHTPHFYRYRHVKGQLFSRQITPAKFTHLLDWLKTNLWRPAVSSPSFPADCLAFYRDKTRQRVSQFQGITGQADLPAMINNRLVPPLSTILDHLNWPSLAEPIPVRFHGDLVLDNILETSDGYCLLDWRQEFAGQLAYGDLYYDLAKINHNLIINHDAINQNRFAVTIREGQINLQLDPVPSLQACRPLLFNFIRQQGYDSRRVEILTSLIWINSAPLHHHPYNLFLFYWGRYHLWQHYLQEQSPTWSSTSMASSPPANFFTPLPENLLKSSVPTTPTALS